jgi:putative restriction endonuclease
VREDPKAKARAVNDRIPVTDNEWLALLSRQQGIDDINFWKPGGTTLFHALNPGEPFLFKLRSPRNYIAGGGFFARSTMMPVSLAWEGFGEKNGAPSPRETRQSLHSFT